MRLAMFCRAEIRGGGGGGCCPGFRARGLIFVCSSSRVYPLPFAVYLFRVLHFNLLL